MTTIGYRTEARDKQGRVHTVTHTLAAHPSLDACRIAAQLSAANCRGKHPWGNRVKIVPVTEAEL